ncbi:MAG: hypothetical protein ACPG19_01190 [Saprospiraceae bacterium]
MEPVKANLVNSTILIILGFWGFAASGWNSTTALIAPCLGVLCLVLTPLFKKQNKTSIYIIIGSTLMLLIALLRPLTRELGQGDYEGVLRVAVMMFSCMVASAIYFRNFLYHPEN